MYANDKTAGLMYLVDEENTMKATEERNVET